MKELATIYRVENASLMNDKLIQECYDNQVDEYFKVKRIKNFVQQRYNISNFKNQIIKYITKCESCWKNKIQKNKWYNEVI